MPARPTQRNDSALTALDAEIRRAALSATMFQAPLATNVAFTSGTAATERVMEIEAITSADATMRTRAQGHGANGYVLLRAREDGCGRTNAHAHVCCLCRTPLIAEINTTLLPRQLRQIELRGWTFDHCHCNNSSTLRLRFCDVCRPLVRRCRCDYDLFNDEQCLVCELTIPALARAGEVHEESGYQEKTTA